VKLRLVLFAVLSISGRLIVGGAGYLGQSRQADALAAMNIMLRALRNHLESNIRYDTLRGDVLAALHAGYTSRSSEADGIRGDLADHVDTFRTRLAGSRKLDLPPMIKNALDKVYPVLGEYEKAARDIVDLSFRDAPAAEAGLDAVNATFVCVADEMEALFNPIETYAEQVQKHAQALAMRGLKQLGGIVLVVSQLCIAFARWTMRTVISPLQRLRAAIDGIRRNDGRQERLQDFKTESRAIDTSFNGLLNDLEVQRGREQELADGTFRARQALSAASADILLTDARNVVT
jgi:methyl-accepting chemotaxis protein